AVISLGHLAGGDPGALNIIPSEVKIGGTARSFTRKAQELIERRIPEIATAIAAAHDCTVEATYRRGYPATVNDVEQTAISVKAAEAAVGSAQVDPNINPLPGGEDFAFMLQERPGCYAFIGNGLQSGDEFVHAPRYDFNDDIIANGVSYWVEVAKTELTTV
ncbi:MAG: M20/M25/M40 family metallo-hydrolase, partial [Alphaproteobacteria bacterium]|nr:M20/M25/M40 family metallo-hydrolase [Alphaproteobacteria bacterium]